MVAVVATHVVMALLLPTPLAHHRRSVFVESHGPHRNVFISMSEAAESKAPFSVDELSALKAASKKPVGGYFGGGVGTGTAFYKKLKAASIGGPVAAETWNEVREDHPVLAQRTDEELSAAFLSLELEKKEQKAANQPTSSDAMSGVVPVAAFALVAVASVAILSGGGACDGELATSKACVEKAERARGAQQTTPLGRYRESVISSGGDFLKAYDRPPAAVGLKASDVQGGFGKLGDADFW